MGDVVNLRRARKIFARRAKEDEATANRAKHGVSKVVRDLAEARRDAEARRLEAHRRASDPTSVSDPPEAS